MKTEIGRTAMVFGATGFIGQWLVKELLDQGVPTTAAVRDLARSKHLLIWLETHGTATDLLQVDKADLSVDGIGLDNHSHSGLNEIYNVAGAYRFGMTPHEARAANVDTSRRVVEFAATVPGLARLVHLSGYRVGGQDPASVPWSARTRVAEYSRLGSYEASKVESDAVVQATAQRLGVPLTIANPATVIGDSATGESDQIQGLATTIRDLVTGKLNAIPGNSGTFLPVVTVDYLARFMTLLPTAEETSGKSYWILDDNTPALPHLLRLIAEHTGAVLPRLRIPVGLLKKLPAALTRADPETLSFLSSDRYPTEPANELARRHGLQQPDVATSLNRWADHLIATGFGTTPHPTSKGPTVPAGGIQTNSIRNDGIGGT